MSADNTSEFAADARTLCPYKEKCYRLNIVHFMEMSHPHLEKLVLPQLNSNIKIPARLNFEVTDREKLLNQMTMVQSALKKLGFKEKDSSTSSSPNDSSNGSFADVSSSSSESKSVLSQSMKDKIERTKKLRETDKASSSGIGNNSSKGIPRKRGSDPDFDDTQRVSDKKSKTESAESTSSSSSSSCSRSSGENTLMKLISSSNTAEQNEKLREQALATLRAQGAKFSLAERGEFALKYALAAPYYIFYTRVEHSRPTYDQKCTVTFPEILDKSLGEIETSLHINFMVELGWLMLQYLLAAQNANMTLIVGEMVDVKDKFPSNVKVHVVPKTSAYGIHHTKLSIFKYKNGGIRIMISTANLYCDDWEDRTQGLWLSPHLPPLPSSALQSDGESSTGFKKDFLKYLSVYDHNIILDWIHLVRGVDFSEVNVFFVGSVPGAHKGADMSIWGHKKVAKVLSEHATLPPDAPQWPLIAQCSSIGSLGNSVNDWVTTDILSSMSQEKNRGIKSLPNFKFIYPSLNNYKASYDCKIGGSCCLPYSIQTHSKQEWLNNFLHEWKSDKMYRTKAMPHIKTYTRISPNYEEIPWFILTSANLSKAAWGRCQKSLYILNYEVGVIFIPKFIINKETFPIVKTENSPDIPVFPMPYDLPLSKYESNDSIFVQDYLYS